MYDPCCHPGPVSPCATSLSGWADLQVFLRLKCEAPTHPGCKRDPSHSPLLPLETKLVKHLEGLRVVEGQLIYNKNKCQRVRVDWYFHNKGCKLPLWPLAKTWCCCLHSAVSCRMKSVGLNRHEKKCLDSCWNQQPSQFLRCSTMSNQKNFVKTTTWLTNIKPFSYVSACILYVIYLWKPVQCATNEIAVLHRLVRSASLALKN